MPNLSENINPTVQLKVILDCLEVHNGILPQLNATQTKSVRNFNFLREERTPSCSLFTKQEIPFVHDFGTGQTYNYVSVYAAVYMVDTSTAYQEILKKYLHKINLEREAKIYQQPSFSKQTKTSSITADITVSPRFKDFELAYFAQYGINAKLLRSYQVFAMRGYKKLASKPGNPVFAFKITEKCYKIYQPLTKNKAYKWFWVGEKPEDFLTYGIENLPTKGNLLFITEGLKDALSIKANTPFEALALDSASQIPPALLIETLKKRFEKIVICFDTDTTGQKQADKIAKQYHLSKITWDIEKDLEDWNVNDISDFFKYYQLTDFRKLSVITYQNPSIKIEQYLTEKVAQKQLFEHFRAASNLILPAPTGSGKNEVVNRFIAEELQRNPTSKFFNGFPNNISAEAKTKEYSKASNNFSELALEIGLLDQYTSSEERKFIGSFQTINFVYNSFHQIEPLVGEGDYLFLDEFHKWVTQGDIAPIPQIQSILDSPAKKVFLSGTPFESFAQEFEIKTLDIQKTKKSATTIKMIELYEPGKYSFNLAGKQQLYKLAAYNFLHTLKPDESKLHLLYLNDREALEQLAQTAQKLGLETEILYSDDEIKRNSTAWKALTTAQPVPLSANKGKVLLMTSLVYDSLNLNNPADEIGKFAIFGEIFIENILQALHRPRKAKNLEVYYFLAAHKDKEDFTESYAQHRAKWYKDYELLSQKLHNYSHISLLKMPEEERQALLHDVSKVLTDDFQFNRLACVIAYEQKKARRQNNLQKKEILNKFYPTSFESCCVNDLSDIKNNIIKEKQEKNLENTSVQILMRENLVYCLAYLAENKLDAQLKARIRDYLGCNFDFEDLTYLQFKSQTQLNRAGQRALRMYVQRFLQWSENFCNETAILDIIFSKKYKAIARQFSVAELLAESGMSVSQQSNLYYYKAVIKQFKIGESYSREERAQIISKVYQELKHLEYSESTKQKLFKALFLTKEDRSKKEERKLQILSVVNLEVLCEIYHLKPSLLPKTDKNMGLKKENISLKSHIFVGEVSAKDCPF